MKLLSSKVKNCFSPKSRLSNIPQQSRVVHKAPVLVSISACCHSRSIAADSRSLAVWIKYELVCVFPSGSAVHVGFTQAAASSYSWVACYMCLCEHYGSRQVTSYSWTWLCAGVCCSLFLIRDINYGITMHERGGSTGVSERVCARLCVWQNDASALFNRTHTHISAVIHQAHNLS